jgi:hypothetical protein
MLKILGSVLSLYVILTYQLKFSQVATSLTSSIKVNDGVQ